MPKFSTAYRLKQIMNERNLKQIDIINLAKPYCELHDVKLGRNDLSQYISGKVVPKQNKTYILAKALNVSESWLMGYEVQRERAYDNTTPKFNPPTVTDDYATFPVIGEIAAGYDNIAVEDWSGEKVDIPASYLKGRETSDFFVLGVKGDSMYPEYHDGDKVLILKQNTLNYSGQVGAVLYDGDCATLKKVEYKDGEDWMQLVPINPSVKPQRIEGVDLERCKVLGIPRLLIRDVKN